MLLLAQGYAIYSLAQILLESSLCTLNDFMKPVDPLNVEPIGVGKHIWKTIVF